MSKLTFTTPCIILFLSIFIFLATIPVVCSNNDTDFQALVAFKNAIESDPMGALFSWNETIHFCSWQGVSCSHRHKDRVASIHLMSRGLVGSISPHLGNLSFLRYISLQNNTFYGQIPNEIGRLRRLEWVTFSNNSLSGEIPKNISQCTNIRFIKLVDNKLTGIIPELNSLVKLRDLALSLNQLSGSFPPSIGNLTDLRQISLQLCGMQGEIPASIVNLKSLRYLMLGVNNLTGSIPLGLFNTSTLSVFEVSANRLEGAIPSDIGSAFPRLTNLYLWGNLFTGEIPTSLSNMSSLSYLFLEKNNFKGRVKIDFSRLSALTRLNLAHNNLDGDLNFISSMANCTQLTHLYINSNQLSGSLPHSIANLSRTLGDLMIGRNPFYGRIPLGMFGGLLGLTTFGLANTYLDGPLPSDIGKLNKLQELDLQENKFSRMIPFSFGNLTSLIYLNLEQNNFTGNIPQSLGNCTNLLQIDLSDNNLNGPIPFQLMSLLSNLIYFNLSHNVLTGSIPVEVGSLINLEMLDLSYNSLSGYVPISLSTCVKLEEIYLQRNSFHGEIHDELRTLRGLVSVDLSRNNLTGTIPSFLGELSLSYLNLSFNRLEGKVPTTGVFLNKSAVSLEGNKDLCGGDPSLDFIPCAHENSKKKRFPLVFKVLIGVGAIALVCCCIFTYKKGTSKDTHAFNIDPSEGGYMRLSYGDLQKSTGGFSESNLLGAGRFGSVYKGILHDVQTSVAVKVLHLNIKGASKSFISECNVLRSIRHRNLLKILSVCSSIDFQENDFKALVYEFMANGNLDELLQRNPGDVSETLSLRQMLDIAIDIACALEYLHFGTGSTIVHGDLKPSNILLDEEMVAHVGDFGLAKIISNVLSTNESSTIGIRGTIGYIPPEYGISGVVSTQGDVYSYGIMLLEMFTGRRPTDEEFEDSWSLSEFVRNALPSQVMEVLNPDIVPEHNRRNNVKYMDCIVLIFEIGLACSMELPKDRMAMPDVVNQLKKASQILAQS